ncbi:polysaccharide deacetylase family protein [Paenibacillus cremeus]|uniref:Polysaccharide deacetylase family protein n=1 Tax=Paenibacillus cremeus TaxID=2163881 RepID=A0A559KHH4_9BACL|nr:polysaccharide deacetylase family protein [Paenibacillus cremeus]TVY11582.1 polysaccharide deacetylase family protein [Paenibacillus cremeus]
MTSKWTILAAAAVLLTACTAAPANSPQPEPTAAPQPAATAASVPQEPKTETKPAEASPPPVLEPKPQATEPPKEAEKTYMLNPKTYDIVPIDPAKTEKKVVLLTFDDGPKDLEMNTGLLDTLDKHHAKAIFFLNGYRIKQKPELVKLIASRGQTIGNHSWDHNDLKKESKENLEHQIGDVQRAIKDLTGKAPSFFRPPFGSGSDDVRAKAKDEKLLYMTWSNGSLDWEMTVKNNNPDKVISNVFEQLRPGSNILMHELPWTVQTLDNLLTRLEEKGYGFVDPNTIEVP